MPFFEANKTYSDLDQDWFAALSKDYNPIHVDTLSARRTPAGVPLVHGLHTVFWCLNELAGAIKTLPAVRSLRVRFLKPVYVGETIQANVSRMDDRRCTVEASIDGSTVCSILIGFGEPDSSCAPFLDVSTELLHPKIPVEADFDNLEATFGRVAFPCSPERLAEAFPQACRVLSASRAASVLTTTTLVGMICPGLYSMLGGLSVTFCPLIFGPEALAYRVDSVDERFRLVRIEIAGIGVFGEVESFARTPPARQATMGEIAGRVPRDAFAGTTALVLGGSRGLGEAGAKILAAGGANVIVTYATGKSDAETVTNEIRQWGGECCAIPYNVREEAAKQLAELPKRPTHLYYFATPPIFQRKTRIFAPDRLAEFLHFYVTAFYDVFQVLYLGAGNKLSAFYPSSIAVQERPADMTEYAMAKAAGEVLCADLATHLSHARVLVNRLPRLTTDQTASLIQADSADPVDVLLPVIFEVQQFTHKV